MPSLHLAEQKLNDTLLQRPFVLAAPSTLLLQVIIPNALTLQARIGPRNLQFVSDDTQVGPINTDYDLAVRIGNMGTVPPLSVRVADEAFGLVHSPRHPLRTNGTLLPSGTVRLISSDRPKIWDDWLDEAEVKLEGDNESLRFDEMHQSLQAPEAGLGVAIAPFPLVVSAISEGRLIAPFGFQVREGGYFAVGNQTKINGVDFRKICVGLADLLKK